MNSETGLLAGIKVVEFTHMVMGPAAGLVLADLGADVTKVEPVGGDKTRRLRGSGAGYFSMYNRNKKSLAIDLKSPEGKELALKLIDEADVFIAPNESYMIFCSIREDGFGQGDLYISFKKDDNNWTTAKNMGATINTKYHELCPVVTRDGKYFFFTSNQDIYWVDAKVIEKYR